MRYLLFSVLVVSLVGVLMFSNDGAEAQTDPGAPYTITDDEFGGDCQFIGTWNSGTKTCTLTTDITSTSNGIIIDNHDITLDGAGHTITGDGGTNDFGVDPNSDNFQIKNLNIQGFGVGVHYDFHRGGTITSNTITSNSVDGIYGTNDALKITNNNISSNGRNGITISNASVSGCSGSGSFVVQQNTISSNTGNGIEAFNHSGICFDQNTVNSNGYGFYILGSQDDIFTSNTANSNTNSGFYFASGAAPETFTGNTASGNGVDFEGLTVPDTTPPVVNVPSNISAVSTDGSSLPVTFTVTSSDDTAVTSGPSCSPASGTNFSVGTTTVYCAAADAAGNISTKSFLVTVNYTPPSEYQQQTQQQTAAEQRISELEAELEAERGGGCLIATATFGSEMAPQVQFLRELRDNTVLQTESGTSFMAGFNQFYYSFSPYIADYERENPAFKETVKLVLTPLLTSLTLLQYTDIDSESEMLGYGIGVILLNIGMYFVAPAVLIMTVRKSFQRS